MLAGEGLRVLFRAGLGHYFPGLGAVFMEDGARLNDEPVCRDAHLRPVPKLRPGAVLQLGPGACGYRADRIRASGKNPIRDPGAHHALAGAVAAGGCHQDR